MTHEEKQQHPWACDLSKGDEQCPYVTLNGSRFYTDSGYLNCVWKKDHPDSLPHEAHYNQPNGPDNLQWIKL